MNSDSELKGDYCGMTTRNRLRKLAVSRNLDHAVVAIQHEFKGRLMHSLTTNITNNSQKYDCQSSRSNRDGCSRFNMAKMFEISLQAHKKWKRAICGDFNFAECFDRREEIEHRTFLETCVEKMSNSLIVIANFTNVWTNISPCQKMRKRLLGIDYIPRLK